PNRDLYVEPLGSGVLADDLTRACDDDPADPRAACCFEDLISAVDVDGHHAPEVRFLVIDTGEVHDRSNVSTGAGSGVGVRKIGSDDLIVEFGLNTLNIEETEGEVLAQQRNNFTTDLACCSRNQDSSTRVRRNHGLVWSIRDVAPLSCSPCPPDPQSTET